MTAIDKADRLLTSGRVTLRQHTGDLTAAIVEGDTDQHLVLRDRGGWSCDCLAWTHRRRCSHIDAVKRVTTTTRTEETTP